MNKDDLSPGQNVEWQGYQYKVFMIGKNFACVSIDFKGNDGNITQVKQCVLISQLKPSLGLVTINRTLLQG